MAKTNLELTLDIKMTVWNEIFSRNAQLQKRLEVLREECANDPDWDPVNCWSTRFNAERDLLLRDLYGFERPFPFPVVEATDSLPEIVFRPDGTPRGIKQHDPPPIRALKVDLRYTREEILHQFKRWLAWIPTLTGNPNECAP